MDNGTFVDNLLDRLKIEDCSDDKILFILDLLKQHYTEGRILATRYPKLVKEKIDLRVKDMLDVIDPMWYVVALYHRNKGGLWRDMHKYGVRSNNASSYKVPNASSAK